MKTIHGLDRIHLMESLPALGFIGMVALVAAGLMSVIVLGMVTL